MWLYCDDTSGNMSKKWNKHNSWLFTAAGLPRALAHQEANVHFLSTSNTAPPLEMLHGIVGDLEYVQQLPRLFVHQADYLTGKDSRRASGPGMWLSRR